MLAGIMFEIKKKIDQKKKETIEHQSKFDKGSENEINLRRRRSVFEFAYLLEVYVWKLADTVFCDLGRMMEDMVVGDEAL